MKKSSRHWWTNEEIDLIEEYHKKGYSLSKITKAMNENSENEYTRGQIMSIYRRYVKTGLRPDAPGQGNNNKKLGTERKANQGYTKVKVEGGNWELKHRAIYKKYYGEIPEDHVILFANGDRKDFRKDNLIAISRKQLSVINQKKLLKDNIEATKTGIILADIIIKMRELENRRADE